MPLAGWLQSPQASGSSSPYQMHQYGFDMVVNGMPDGNLISSNGLGDLGQEGIAHLTRCLLQGKTLPGLIGFDITPFESSREVKLAG